MSDDDSKRALVKAPLYRDGKPLESRTRAEIAAIAIQHLDPDHPDHNPRGETAPASVSAAYALIETERSRSIGGKIRGEQKRKQGDNTKALTEAAEQRQTRAGKRPTNKTIAREVGKNFEHIGRLRRRKKRT